MKYIQLFEKYLESTKYTPIKIDSINKSAYKKLNSDIEQFLSYLVHDKKHVLDNVKPSYELDRILSLVKNTVYSGYLYRGLYPIEVTEFKVGQTGVFNRYTSFSESIDIAKNFAYDTKFLFRVKNPKGGFNYGGWMQGYFNDVEEINFARYEREHIFSQNQKYQVTGVNKQGSFTIVDIEFLEGKPKFDYKVQVSNIADEALKVLPKLLEETNPGIFDLKDFKFDFASNSYFGLGSNNGHEESGFIFIKLKDISQMPNTWEFYDNMRDNPKFTKLFSNVKDLGYDDRNYGEYKGYTTYLRINDSKLK